MKNLLCFLLVFTSTAAAQVPGLRHTPLTTNELGSNLAAQRAYLGLPYQLYPGISDLLAAGEYRVAHRGGAKEFHPQSIMAFDHCLAANVPIVEIDTYPLRYEDNGASDGGIALHHGADVSETSLTSGAIGSFTLAQWKLIPFDGGESVFFPHASGTTYYQPFQHPTNETHIDLDTFLARYANKLVVINNVYGTGTVPAIVNRLRQYGVDTNHWLFMPNSTGQDSIDAYNSGYPLILLTSSTNTFKTFYDAHGKMFGAAMDASTYGASTIADFKHYQSDLKMVGFTATTDYDLKAYRALGYDMILADKPSWPGMTPQTLVNIGAPSLRFSMISIGSFGSYGTNTYRFTNNTFAVDTVITTNAAFFCIGQASPLTATNGVSLKAKVTFNTLGSGKYGGLCIGTRDDNFAAAAASYKGMRFTWDASSYGVYWYNGSGSSFASASHSIGATLSSGNTYYLCISIDDSNIVMSVRNSSDVAIGSSWTTSTFASGYPTTDCRGPYIYGWMSGGNIWTWDTLAVTYP